MVASPDDINGLIGRMSRLDDAVAEAVEEGEEELADVTEIRESAEDAPVIKLVNSIIAQAVEEGARTSTSSPRAARCACASASTACCARPRRSRSG